MLIALDVDGVLADFLPAALQAAGSRLPASEIQDWNFFCLLTSSELSKARQAMASQEFWARLEPIKGSQEGVAHLRLEGHDVIFATTPWRPCKGWEEARESWLSRHFEAAHYDVYCVDDKTSVPWEILVEDKPETIARCQHAGLDVRKHPQPYNQHVQCPEWRWI